MIIWLFKVVCLFIQWSFRTSYFNPPPKKYFVVTFLAMVGIESVVCEDPFITDSPWNCVFWRSWWRLYQPVNGFQILQQELLGKTKKTQNASRIHSCIANNFSKLRWNRKIRSYLFESNYLVSLDKDLFDGAVLFLEMLNRGNYIVFMSASIHLF